MDRQSEYSNTQGRQLMRPPESGARPVMSARRGDNLADILERVLDKGIVIAGDITVSLASVELLTIKVRLLIASVDKAQEMGINWWQSDPALTTKANQLERENTLLRERLERLENRLALLPEPTDAPDTSDGQSAGQHDSRRRRPRPPHE